MHHPFEIGGKYRNRRGEYEVIELEGSRMVIRYSDGNRLETNVEMQQRIWQNIQAEERLKKPTRISSSRQQQRGGQRGLAFQGLEEHDFKRGVAGTSWRSRKNLGGMLAQRMSDTTPHFFQSYAIYRRAEVHIVRPAYYHSDTRWRETKFVFDLDEQCARYGFYIEKNDGPMDDTWHWLHFVSALDKDKGLRGEVKAAMDNLNLHWEVYVWDDGGLIAEVRVAQDGLIWDWQDTDKAEDISWDDFTKRLQGIETQKWCDLHLCARMIKDKAIGLGIQIVDPVTEVYRALLPLYEASILRAGRAA